MDETFLLSNVVPQVKWSYESFLLLLLLIAFFFGQDADNNGDFWNRLEIYCRDLSMNFADVFVVSGPLWLAQVSVDPSMVCHPNITYDCPGSQRN